MYASMLLEEIKEIAKDTIAANDPVEIRVGKVESVDPLGIRLNEKIVLGEANLVLYESVRDIDYDCQVQMALPFSDDEMIGSRSVCTTARITMHNALKVGEMVIMYREQGGQRYHVVSRCPKEIKEGGGAKWLITESESSTMSQ